MRAIEANSPRQGGDSFSVGEKMRFTNHLKTAKKKKPMVFFPPSWVEKKKKKVIHIEILWDYRHQRQR